MCANYLPATPNQLQRYFGVAPPDSDYKAETYPGYMAPIIRPPHADTVPGDRACASAMFGIVPHWAKDTKIARNTYNARTETVAEKPSFRSAFKRGQFCIIPAASIFEPRYFQTDEARSLIDDYVPPKHRIERWEITSANDLLFGIAGIWEYKQDGPNGLPLLSFSMLTINADDHPVMQLFHAPTDEKRMVVILHPDQYDEWLHCDPREAPEFFLPYPPEGLRYAAAPRQRRTAESR
jgi:putative SOS response-associated peptidase YedK